MEFDSPLTMTGLIATIFGMIFALAAFITSRRKQAHKTVHVPPKTDDTLTPLPENQALQHHPTESRLASVNATKKPNKYPLTVFKQVGPQGKEVISSTHYADDEYIWE